MPNNNEFQEYLNRLTDNALHSLKHADVMAKNTGSSFVGTEHLLLGLLSQEGSMANKILTDIGVSLPKVKNLMKITPEPIMIHQSGVKGLSETAKLTLKMSWEVAQEYNQDYCGTEHILFSLINQKNSRATLILKEMNIDVEKLIANLESFLSRQQYESTTKLKNGPTKRSNKSALELFGTDLTALAREGRLDPVVGREEVIRRVITILARRTKNNPVLIGEPGVGKTAIAEGLAQQIVSENVPDVLLDKKTITIDLAAMVAGTKYRGEFEERLKKVLSELIEDNNTVAFIDEIHQIVGAGAAEGAIDAGNILKPALARGQIQVIGATTTTEYTKHIEKDAALERRFQPIKVPETNKNETLAILRGLKKHYENYHEVEISDEVLKDTVYMADRYINDRFMPDKAIDLLDETAAHVKVQKAKVSPEQRQLQKEQKITMLKIEQAVDDEDYEKAAKFKQKLSQINEKLTRFKNNRSKSSVVSLTLDDIASTIANMTGIPVKRVVKSEAKTLLDLEKTIAKHLIGQDEAIHAVARAIRRGRSGIAHANKPTGSFVFLGPTGVGKTELARTLAREYFGSENALVKIDMSEFSEKHTVSRLVGAPAGYVGYDEGGQLTDKIRRQPYSLVLFDEIEKAHPDIFHTLLQILEDGYLTDAKGRRVDFSNTIVIMTGNVGAEKLQKELKLGFQVHNAEDEKRLDDIHQQNSKMVHDELKKIMKPELINRIDRIIVFRSLSKQDIGNIVDNQLHELNERLTRKHLAINTNKAVKNWLLEKGFDSKNGVRPLKRCIQDHIEDHIAEGLLKGEFQAGDVINVTLKNDQLHFDVDRE